MAAAWRVAAGKTGPRVPASMSVMVLDPRRHGPTRNKHTQHIRVCIYNIIHAPGVPATAFLAPQISYIHALATSIIGSRCGRGVPASGCLRGAESTWRAPQLVRVSDAAASA